MPRKTKRRKRRMKGGVADVAKAMELFARGHVGKLKDNIEKLAGNAKKKPFAKSQKCNAYHTQ